MKIKHVEKLYISGLGTRTNNANELAGENPKIPQLWEDYDQKNILGATFDKVNNMSMYGVYNEYESDENGDFTVTIGVEVSKPKKAIVIENQRYLVFEKKGELPEIVLEVWAEIWEYFGTEPEYERAFKIDFEKYSKENFVEIYISVK